jgi:hypothetical protein
MMATITTTKTKSAALRRGGARIISKGHLNDARYNHAQCDAQEFRT